MTLEVLFVAGLLLVVFLLFFTGWVRPDVTALGALAVLGLSGVITPAEALAGFADPAVVTIGALFIVSAALTRTGVVERVGQLIVRLSRGSHSAALLLLLLWTAGLSAFVNNTPVVLVFLPICQQVGRELKMSTSKVLIPIAYAGTLGGMMTLVGTSITVLVSSRWVAMGGEPLGMFETAPLGAIVLVAGLVYLFTIGRRLLPERATIASAKLAAEYLTEVRVPAGSRLLGKTLDEVGFYHEKDLKLLQWIRDGDPGFPPFPRRSILREGDVLLVKGSAKRICAILEKGTLHLPAVRGTLTASVLTRRIRLAEVVVGPASPLVGRSVNQARIWWQQHFTILGLQRKGRHMRERLGEVQLEVGDVLLIHGSEKAVEGLRNDDYLLLLEEVDQRVPLTRKAPIAGLLVVAVIAAISTGIAPVELIALAGAGLAVLTGCVDADAAYHEVDWRVLMLIVGTIGLGQAVESSGLAALLAGGMVDLLLPFGAVGLLAGVLLTTNLLSHVLSKASAALIVLPIAAAVAQQGIDGPLDPRPFMLAVVFGASLSFAVPTSYQTYMLVFNPGSYRFSDYVRVGLPLGILCMVLVIVCLPWLSPLAGSG